MGPPRLDAPPIRSRRSSARSPSRSSNGIGGKRYPVTIECASDVTAACKRVTAELNVGRGAGRRASCSATGSGPDTLGVVVGTWNDVHGEVAAELIAHGPARAASTRTSPVPPAASLQLLNPRGQVVAHARRRRRADRGHRRQPSTATVWLITGTDVAGVLGRRRRAHAGALHDHFALAVQGGTELPVPLGGDESMSYRRRASPLHAARAGAGCAYCLALGARGADALEPGRARRPWSSRARRRPSAAGVGREIRRAALFALPLGARDRGRSTRSSAQTG